MSGQASTATMVLGGDHDRKVRECLGVIAGFTQVLMEDDRLTPDQWRLFVTKIRLHADALHHLVAQEARGLSVGV